MTPEEKSLLERTYKLAEENNGILRKMRRGTRITNIARIAYWAVIILLSFGAFYFIQPYVNSIMSGLSTGIGGNSGIPQSDDTSSMQLLKDLLR